MVSIRWHFVPNPVFFSKPRFAAKCKASSVFHTRYDAFNRLVGRTLDADGSSGTGDIAQTVYVYDGDQIALQFNKTSANGSVSELSASDLSHRYLWNPQAIDHLFADEDVADEEVLFTLTDHQGTIRDLATYDSGTDTTTVANHRVYDSFGNLKSETNAAVDCLFGYTGRLYDEAVGLQNNLNRWYDSTVGRWLSEDPIGFAGSDANLCRYVGNQPTIYVDPSGYAGVATRIAAGTAAGAAGGAATGSAVGAAFGFAGGLAGGWAGAKAGAAAGAAGGATAGAVAGAMAGALNAALAACGDPMERVASDAAKAGAEAGAVAGGVAGLAKGLAKGLAARAEKAREAAKAAQSALREFTDPFRGIERPGSFPKPGEYSPPSPKPPSGYDGWLPPGDQYPGP